MTHPPSPLSHLLSPIFYLLSLSAALCPLHAAENILENAQKGISAWCVDPCGARPVLPDDDGATALSGGLDAVAAGGSVATLSLAVKSATPVSSLSVSCDGLACGERKLPASAVDLLPLIDKEENKSLYNRVSRIVVSLTKATQKATKADAASLIEQGSGDFGDLTLDE